MFKKIFGAAVNPLIIIIAVLIVAIGATGYFTILDPALDKNAVENTFEELFFDPEIIEDIADKLNAKGYSAELDVHVSKVLSKIGEDLDLAYSGGAFPKRDIGSARFTVSLGKGDDRSEVDINVMYDEDTVLVGGLMIDREEYISAPRKDIVNKLDESVFHPESGSEYALDSEEYDELVEALRLIEEDGSEKKLEKDLKKYSKELFKKAEESLNIEIKLRAKEKGFGFERVVTASFSGDDLKELLETAVDMLGDYESLEKYYDALSDGREELDDSIEDGLAELNFEFTAAVCDRVVDRAELTASGEKDGSDFESRISFDFDREKKNSSFTLVIESDGYNGTVGVESRVCYEYAKLTDGKEVNAELKASETIDYVDYGTVVDSISETAKITLEYDKGDGEFKVSTFADEKNNFNFEGEFRLYRRNGGFELFVNDFEIVAEDFGDEELITVSLKLERDNSAKKLDIPSGCDILSATDDEIYRIKTHFYLEDMIKILKCAFDARIDVNLTVDGRPVYMEYEFGNYLYNIVQVAYQNEMKTWRPTAEKNSRKYVFYAEDIGAYVLFERFVRDDYAGYKVEYSYELTDDILAEYHPIEVDGDNVKWHDYQLISRTEPTCISEGEELVKCSICQETFTRKLEKVNHTPTMISEDFVSDNGRVNGSWINMCAYCHMPLSGAIGYESVFFYELEDGYEIGYSGDNFVIPDYIQELVDIVAICYTLPNLVSARIPDGVCVIEQDDFRFSPNLEVLVLHGDVCEVKSFAFSDDITLKRIFFEGTEEEWNAIELNEYREAWSGVEIVFAPDGVTPEMVAEVLNQTEA